MFTQKVAIITFYKTNFHRLTLTGTLGKPLLVQISPNLRLFHRT
ncbi:hypothetical protein EVA_05889 [gut metagenome]|uniref:Uncharacterized protein n=1 Tax=gut metagenome TaxID=749906 RepID=J9GYR3_9ZZZZ